MPILAPVDRPEGAGAGDGVVVAVDTSAALERVFERVDDVAAAELWAADDVGATGGAGGVVSV